MLPEIVDKHMDMTHQQCNLNCYKHNIYTVEAR